MARLLVLGAVWVVTGGSQYSCSSDGTGRISNRDLDSGDGPTFTTTLVLRDTAGAETYTFQRGETIRFELTVRNRTDTAVHVQFPSPLQGDYVVFNDGGNTPRWQASEGRVFAAVVTEVVFEPHESKIFAAEWNQETRNGTLLERGNYEARGVLWFDGFATNPLATHELGSTLRAFTVN
jgi:hypothetical protein